MLPCGSTAMPLGTSCPLPPRNVEKKICAFGAANAVTNASSEPPEAPWTGFTRGTTDVRPALPVTYIAPSTSSADAVTAGIWFGTSVTLLIERSCGSIATMEDPAEHVVFPGAITQPAEK